MAFTMELTDGTTTIDILQTNDTTVGYHLQTESYTPQINRRNPSDFGAVYLPVLENFTIAIVGSTPNDVHVKLAALVNLMDNVRLWFDSDAAAADAVTFVFKPGSSTEAAEYQALIVSDAEIGYSQYIEHVGNWYRMPDIRVSFMRNEWLRAEEIAISAPATNIIRNPSLEIDTAGWLAYTNNTISRSTDQAHSGTYSLKQAFDGGIGSYYTIYDYMITAATYTASAWVYIPDDWDGGGIYAELVNFTSSVFISATAPDMTKTNQWQRISETRTINAADLDGQFLIAAYSQPTAGRCIYIDSASAELWSTATTYIDGDQVGCVWNGAAHASTSTRVTTQPSVVQVGFNSAAALPSPVDIEIQLAAASAAGVYDTALFTSRSPILFTEAETMTLGSNFSVLAETEASGGSLLSYTPNAGVATSGTSTAFFSYPITYRNYAVWAVVRNKSATIDYEITTGVVQATHRARNNVIVGAGDVTPRIVHMGNYSLGYTPTTLTNSNLSFTVGASAGSGTLDIDCFIITSTDSDSDGYTSHIHDSLATLSNPKGFRVENRALTFMSGSVMRLWGGGGSSDESGVPYTGDARLSTLSDDVYAVVFATYDNSKGWRYWSLGSSTTQTVTATRRLASLTPL